MFKQILGRINRTNNTPKSQYTFWFDKHAFKNILIIEDLNQGGMSVTNNIENVLDEIIQDSGVFIHSYMIVYRDSDGIWDGYDYQQSTFVYLGENDWKSAVEKYCELQANEKSAVKL